jgi:tetratricopeptide (TPR) repeat protein
MVHWFYDDLPWGDRIILNDSSIDLSAGSIIRNSTYSDMWDGILIKNSRERTSGQRNNIRGNISGIRFITITEQSQVYIDGATISNIEGLEAYKGSYLNMNNSQYTNNEYGIRITDNSFLYLNNSNVNENESDGLSISYSYMTSRVTNSTIQGNAQSGITLNQGYVEMINNNVMNNNVNGFSNISSAVSLIRDGNNFKENLMSQIFSDQSGFPVFSSRLPDTRSEVRIDNNSNPEPNQLLLSAFTSSTPPIYPRINVRELKVAIGNRNLFEPCYFCFQFTIDIALPPIHDIIRTSFEEGVEDFYESDYEEALDKFLSIIEEYPDSEYALSSIPFLPALYIFLDLDTCDLIGYLNILSEDEIFSDIAREIIGITQMFNSLFVDAIYTFNEIIEEYPETIEALLAELNIYYCILKLYESGERSFPSVVKNIPKNYFELFTFQEEILGKIINNKDKKDEESKTPQTPLLTALESNYPNPFNPETTILFSTENVGNVEINVYNIRGQRIRNLVNDFFEAGHHQVVWNGRDNSDREVSSGIYLYRMNVGDFVETRRMVLLK